MTSCSPVGPLAVLVARAVRPAPRALAAQRLVPVAQRVALAAQQLALAAQRRALAAQRRALAAQRRALVAPLVTPERPEPAALPVTAAHKALARCA